MMGAGVASTGCLRKKDKNRCNKRDPKPDPKTSSQVHGGTSTKKDDPPKTTEEAKSCKIKRAPYQPEPTRLVKKFGDVEERKEEECNNGQTTTIVHRTTTELTIGYYVQDRKDMPKVVCKKEHTQACYHYRYAMTILTRRPALLASNRRLDLANEPPEPRYVEMGRGT